MIMNIHEGTWSYVKDLDSKHVPGYRIKAPSVSLVAWVPFASVTERDQGEDIARILAAAPDMAKALMMAYSALKAADRVCFSLDGAVSVQVAQARDIVRNRLLELGLIRTMGV